jgi:hypothetical protein
VTIVGVACASCPLDEMSPDEWVAEPTSATKPNIAIAASAKSTVARRA